MLPSQVMYEDIALFDEIKTLRQFVTIFHKQGKASQFSGGLGRLSPEEERYLEAIQDALDAREREG